MALRHSFVLPILEHQILPSERGSVEGREGKKGYFKLMDFLLATWMQNISMRDKKSLDSGYLG